MDRFACARELESLGLPKAIESASDSVAVHKEYISWATTSSCGILVDA